MPMHVACVTCRRTFPARQRPGLVRCPRCEETHAPRMPRAATRVVVVATPGDPWD